MTYEQLKQACKVVEIVRRAVGDDVELLLEFHGRFSPINAPHAGTGQFRIFAERTLDAIVDVSGYFAP